MTEPQPYYSRGGGHLQTRQGVPEQREAAPGAGDRLVPVPQTDRYEIIARAGEGGMGLVWKARDNRLGRLVAIKRILPTLAASPEFLSRFRREARVVAALHHPNIVPLFDLDEDADGLFQVMQWIEGQNLQQLLSAEGPLSVERAVSVVVPVSEALASAHDAGIIHRDVKPANILLESSGIPYLTDFGLVRIETATETLHSAGGTLTNAVLGTIEYMAPEQAADPRQASAASDQWSLAATLYQALTGRTVRGLRESLIPEKLRVPILTALEYEPADRFASLREFAAALTRQEPAGRRRTAARTVSPPAEAAAPAPQPVEETDLAGLLRQMQSRVEATVTQADRVVSERQDYAEAVRLLETVPDHLQNSTRLQELRSRRDRVRELDAEIESRVRQVHLEGLRERVEELLGLQPGRSKLRELLETLPREVVRSRPVVREGTQAGERWSFTLGGIEYAFRWCPAGKFMMGSPLSEEGRHDDEDQVQVELTRGFWLQETPVTQGMWESVMGTAPWHEQMFMKEGAKIATSDVNWHNAQEFCVKLQALGLQAGLITSSQRIALPSEARWEYACRAGTTTAYSFGNDTRKLGEYAWYNGNAWIQGEEYAHEVGLKKANGWGLQDMHGNVWEWCVDCYGWKLPGGRDPQVSAGSSRVLRGGSFFDESHNARCANRRSNAPTNRDFFIGFRVVIES